MFAWCICPVVQDCVWDCVCVRACVCSAALLCVLDVLPVVECCRWLSAFCYML